MVLEPVVNTKNTYPVRKYSNYRQSLVRKMYADCDAFAHFEVRLLMTPGVVLYCLANAKIDAIPYENKGD